MLRIGRTLAGVHVRCGAHPAGRSLQVAADNSVAPQLFKVGGCEPAAQHLRGDLIKRTALRARERATCEAAADPRVNTGAGRHDPARRRPSKTGGVHSRRTSKLRASRGGVAPPARAYSGATSTGGPTEEG